MRKLKLFFACLLMAVLSIGQVWGAPAIAYTLTPASGSNNSYASACDIAIEDEDNDVTITWNLTGNSQMQPWRIGVAKKTAEGSATRSLYSKQAISENITNVVVSHSAKSGFTTVAVTLNVYSTAAKAEAGGTGDISSVSVTYADNTTMTFNRPSGHNWEGRFFRFDYDLTWSYSSSAQYIAFASAVFNYESSGGGSTKTDVTDEQLSWSASSATVTLGETPYSLPSLTNTESLAVTYESTDATVATITNGVVSILKAGTTTIKAKFAGNDTYNAKTVSYTLTVNAATMDAIFAAATANGSTAKDINIIFNNWVVSGVNGKTAYVTDGTKGFIVYYDNHGFAEGDILSGTGSFKLKLYGGAAEITEKVSGTINIAKNGSVTPIELDAEGIAALTGVNTGSVIKITGTCSSNNNKYYINDVQLYNALYNFGVTADTEYDCTGVYIYYKKNADTDAVNEIAPRSADDIEEKQAATLPEVTGLAELKDEEKDHSYIVNLTNAVVTYVNGNNAFIEDATAGALIYFSNHGYVAGDCLNGKYQVTTTSFNGKFEITAMEAQTGATQTTVEEAQIPLTTLTIAQLNANFATYESRRVKIEGVTVTDALVASSNDRQGTISKGSSTLALYAGIKNTIDVAAESYVDIIGFPGFNNTNQQLTIWDNAHITVIELEDPELAYDPTEVNYTLGETFAPAELTYATGFDGVDAIEYESSNPSVAEVTDAGVVSIVATEAGSATITATFGGNDTYKADQASYTINVYETVPPTIYTMSFDLTKASYDAAADAEVVWNSNVVTMTATQNTGTKVNNYLGGDYYHNTSNNQDTYTLNTQTRLYNNNSLSFAPKAGVTITKVEWVATASSFATAVAGFTWTNASAAVDSNDGSKVIVTPQSNEGFSVAIGATTRISQIIVYYTSDEEKAKLTASIDIENMNMAVGDDDILLSAIAATSNPNKKAISYEVTDGTAVSIVGEGALAALHAVAAGEATITATIPDNLGNYTGATKTFTVTVAAGPATLESIVISGTASNLEYTEGQTFNPAGLKVMGTYSDQSVVEITEGIEWTFSPATLTVSDASVSVTATVDNFTSEPFVVNGLTVSAAIVTTKTVVVIAEYNNKLFAMSNSVKSSACAAIEVTKDGDNLVVTSDENKAAIQWYMSQLGSDVKLQVTNDEGKYLSNGDGNALSLSDDEVSWTYAEVNGKYLISKDETHVLMFQNSGQTFKHYATSNTTGYARISEIFVVAEGATNIEVVVPVVHEFAVNPDEAVAFGTVEVGENVSPKSFDVTLTNITSATVELSENAAFSIDVTALTASGTITVTPNTTNAGNFSATITLSDDDNLAEDKVINVTMKVVAPKDCDREDDFNTVNASSPSSYLERTSTDGWSAVKTAVATKDDVTYWMINGKTTEKGIITSPEFNYGIKQLSFDYYYSFNESNGISFKVEIKQNGSVVKTENITDANAVKNQVYTATIEDINVEGKFQIVFTNLCPTGKSSGNADRYAIGNLCWKKYGEPVYENVREELTAGWYYTMCLEQAVAEVKGGSIWRVLSKAENGTDVILEEVTGTLDAGRPYIFNASAANLEVIYDGKAVNAPLTTGNNGLVGSFTQEEITISNDNYIIYNNQLYFVNSLAYVGAHRAYLNMNDVPAYNEPQQQGNAPRRRVTMTVHSEQTTTGIENAQGDQVQSAKVLINGQLFIIRGEKMYNANGQVVK